MPLAELEVETRRVSPGLDVGLGHDRHLHRPAPLARNREQSLGESALLLARRRPAGEDQDIEVASRPQPANQCGAVEVRAERRSAPSTSRIRSTTWSSCSSSGRRGARRSARTCAKTRKLGCADRQLVELGVDAAELVAPAEVGALHVRPAHRQRLPTGPNSTEARGPGFGFLQELKVDLDGEDPLHAPHVGAADFLERVEEGTRPRETGGRVDDLVAVNSTPAALDLVLGPEREAPRTGRRPRRHSGFWVTNPGPRKT